jgi:hypothetical protein
MAITKVQNINPAVDVVQGLPNRPQLPPPQLKQRFDQSAANIVPAVNTVVVSGINGVIDELESTQQGSSGADKIGATPVIQNGADTVQGILGELEQTKFEKANVTVSATMGTATNKVPSEYTVTEALIAGGLGDMMRSVYDTNHDGVVDAASSIQEVTF